MASDFERIHRGLKSSNAFTCIIYTAYLVTINKLLSTPALLEQYIAICDCISSPAECKHAK
ncbi:hypothetical protein AL056_27460 [Pseudomonas amygdali pv. morsprunorum]|nr:hypothetical protein BKM19_013240 [Pseudomonas amygdali pv. morsprunorum]KWS56741.1 hypothetical protein AL056_27460 [Pseudomonas amygdali pv. morsprunorum]KWS62756.1 hypothetical protein AL054_04140 [Pseudomonas amygdali pv. morsprunorum]PHX36688.1 hypothetical protein AO282_28975 [Pseudomonas amygdali pv. morsprunorum]POC87687.1 hypothetical protein BKM08_11220 [Pseudomonas amygdali pv. morsprunorum]